MRIGVSACLLGQEVRFDGGHKRAPFVADELARFAELVPVCPEVEVGMGVPRPTLRLVAGPAGPRMLTHKSDEDWTARMDRFSERRARELAALDLDGFVLKKDSPSCGAFRVKVYPAAGGAPERQGQGLFARALMAAQPLLPVEEDGRLQDAALRECFVERVFAWRRLKDLFGPRWTVGHLVAAHAREKLLLLAHEPAAYSELGRLVARAKQVPRAELVTSYQTTFMRALARPATVRRHVNVLQHAAGYFKKSLDDGDRRELAEVIERYGQGQLPLIVPVTLLAHHVRRQNVSYLAGQSYLAPHPAELKLRNHA